MTREKVLGRLFLQISLACLLASCAVHWANSVYGQSTMLADNKLQTSQLVNPIKKFFGNGVNNTGRDQMNISQVIYVPSFSDYSLDSGDQAWELGIFVVIAALGASWALRRIIKNRSEISSSFGRIFNMPKPIQIDFSDTKYIWSRILRKTGVAVPLMGLCIMTWIVVATIIVSYLANWPPGHSFFYVVNSGFQRDFNCPFPEGPNLNAGRIFTFANKLVGAILFSTALVFFLNSMMENIKGDAKTASLIRCADNAALRASVGDLYTGGPYKTIAIDTAHTGVANGIGIDTTGDGLVDTVVVKPPTVFFTPDRIYLGGALLWWLLLGAAYGLYFEGWDALSSLTFALTTLTIGGAVPLAEEAGRLPEAHAWALGAWVVVGVPLTATTVAAYTSFLVEANMREHDQRALDAPLSVSDYEIARRIINKPEPTLDRAEFVIMQLLRMGKTDLTTIALILNKFEEVDLDGDNVLTEEEVLACMSGRQVSGHYEVGDGRRSHMDLSVFHMRADGAVLGRGEDRAGPFEMRGAYDAAAGRIAMDQFRVPCEPAAGAAGATPRRLGAPLAAAAGGGGGAAKAVARAGPPAARFEGTVRVEGPDTVIDGTWFPTAGGGGAPAAPACAAGRAAAEEDGPRRGFTLRVRGPASGRSRRFFAAD